MDPAAIKAKLDADLAAYQAAATAAERQAALSQWLGDATPIVEGIASYAANVGDKADTLADKVARLAASVTSIADAAVVAGYPVRRLVRLLIDRGVIWNPELRSQIGDDNG